MKTRDSFFFRHGESGRSGFKLQRAALEIFEVRMIVESSLTDRLARACDVMPQSSIHGFANVKVNIADIYFGYRSAFVQLAVASLPWAGS